MKPIIYLLCGLPGSGKTTYAKDLEKKSALRLTLDEEIFKRFGREYDDHEEKQRATKDDLKKILKEKIQTGQSVILDFGFWKKANRDEYKKLVEDNGGQWKLLYFKADKALLMKRLASRNVSDVDNNHVIDGMLLDRFITEFEEPKNEDEMVIRQ